MQLTRTVGIAFQQWGVYSFYLPYSPSQAAGSQMTELATSHAPRSDLEVATVDDVRDCGCQLGASVASLALVGYLVVTIALPRLTHTRVAFVWWEALVAFLAGAVIGKTVGVFRARRLHHRRRS